MASLGDLADDNRTRLARTAFLRALARARDTIAEARKRSRSNHVATAHREPVRAPRGGTPPIQPLVTDAAIATAAVYAAVTAVAARTARTEVGAETRSGTDALTPLQEADLAERHSRAWLDRLAAAGIDTSGFSGAPDHRTVAAADAAQPIDVVVDVDALVDESLRRQTAPEPDAISLVELATPHWESDPTEWGAGAIDITGVAVEVPNDLHPHLPPDVAFNDGRDLSANTTGAESWLGDGS